MSLKALLVHRRRTITTPGGGGGGGGGGSQSQSYTVDSATDFPNPERGWYVENSSDYSFTSGENNPAPVNAVAPAPTLQMRYVRLDDYRTSDTLPSGFLNTLAAEMTAWRSSGRKAVLRYAYNRGSATTDNDATLTRTLAHIAQLGALWNDYADVIAVLQAGFIGRWGEWNSSSSGNLTKANRNTVIDALLAAAPPQLMIALRKPLWHYDRWPTPFAPSAAWTGTPQARTGGMNDSFVADAGHGGTFYDGDGMTYAQMRAYWAAINPYVVYGGETSDVGGLNATNDGSAAITEMQAYHLDYLNSEFWTSILNKWSGSGHLAQISRRLGYRLALLNASLPTSIAPNQAFQVELEMRNDGFGKVYKPRPIDLVLVPTAGSTVTVRLTSDARADLPGGGITRTLTYLPTLPGGTPAGQYAAYLALPDASPNLAGDARYAVRLANVGVWSAATGRNNLAMTVTVL